MTDALMYAARKVKTSVSMYDNLMAVDRKLVSAGFPPMSPWWKKTLKEFYTSGKRRLVMRVGRRGGKSSTLCRVAVVETLFGEHDIPPGDVGVFAFISIRKTEAHERLRTIKEILDVLGVRWRPQRDDLKVEGMPRVFRVYGASFRTVVGGTSIGIIGDEVSRWRDDEMGANPATEVLRSIRPSMLTMPNSHEFLSSSPWSTLDAHYEHFEMGNTEDQMVSYATSWEANPTVTESYCETLEPDLETFNREYRAIPMKAGLSAFFDPVAIEESILPSLALPRELEEGNEVVAGADFGFRSDFSALYVGHKKGDIYFPGEYMVVKPEPGRPLRPSTICETFSNILVRHNNHKSLMADHHYREAIVEHLSKHRIAFLDSPRDVPSVFVRLRTLFHQDRVRLPDDKSLRNDLIEVQSRPTPNGAVRIVLPRRSSGGHADLVSALALATWQRAGARMEIKEKVNPAQEEAKRYEEYLRKEEYGTNILYSERDWIIHE